MQPGGHCFIDSAGVFVRVSCPTDTDGLTDRGRQTEKRKLLVPGSASAGCCRAGRVLMIHFSHVCLDVCLHVCMSVCVDGCLCLYVCVCFPFTLCGRLRPRSGVNVSTVFYTVKNFGADVESHLPKKTNPSIMFDVTCSQL